MTDQQLGEALEDPRVHGEILGSYHQQYSMGVTCQNGKSAIIIRFRDNVPKDIPAEIAIFGEMVSVISRGNCREIKKT